MVSYFDWQRTAQGDKFISRNDASRLLAAQIREKKFSTIYAAPGSGKQSLIERVFHSLKASSYPMTVITLDLFNVTGVQGLCRLYTEAFKKPIEEYNRDALFPIRISTDNISTSLALNLPNVLAGYTGANYVIYFKEFQNILNFEKGEELLKLMERELESHQVSYVVTGEQVNAMKNIFEHHKYFYKINCNVPLAPLEKRASMLYLRNGFLHSGKDLEEETGEAIYLTAKGNPLIMNKLAASCDSLSIGYINKRILRSAVDSYFYDYEPQYRFIMSNLTANQVNFMRAVCDGVEKFSSSDVMKKYNLNSSANVFRLKEALSKKEIVTFDSEDRATIIDPMFEQWLKKRYFVQ